jgi:hypothetical protein
MTLIVGLHLNHYVLIGADTRISYYPNDTFTYRDDEAKIWDIDMGLITGAGLANLLDPVKERLDDDELGFLSNLSQTVKDEVARIRCEPWATKPRVKDAIETTAWMFSFVGVPEPKQPAVMRLGFTVPDQNYEIACVQPNTGYLFPPTGTTVEQYREWTAFVSGRLKPFDDQQDTFGSHLAHHIKLIGEIIETVSDVNEGVSKSFQFGIHVFPRPRGISNILTLDTLDTLDIDWSSEPA